MGELLESSARGAQPIYLYREEGSHEVCSGATDPVCDHVCMQCFR